MAAAHTQYREAWLNKLDAAISPWIHKLGLPVPEHTVSCSFPISGARPGKNQTIGQCIYTVKDDRPFVAVSPVLSDDLAVAATLAHELLHVALGSEVGHKAPFAKAAVDLGLEGKPTSTHAGPIFIANIEPVLAKLGPYPHSPVSLGDVKKQTTRLLKAECPLGHGDADKPYIVRLSAATAEVGLPICPVHGDELTLSV